MPSFCGYRCPSQRFWFLTVACTFFHFITTTLCTFLFFILFPIFSAIVTFACLHVENTFQMKVKFFQYKYLLIYEYACMHMYKEMRAVGFKMSNMKPTIGQRQPKEKYKQTPTQKKIRK
ncbi:unnamed protein product [Ceratitis capitata]|uniref:(Mediterranean fruit fly) hypothetical protein n=1 Tax=Ceratitis capitata TaxID=7213 RepID=A0A811V9S0_CERCA|nr:unnamed protein product [Ceratitis capitata]